MVRWIATVAAGLALTASGLVLVSEPAGAQSVSPLGDGVSLGSGAVFSSMAVDPVDQEVFVSLPSSGTVDVFGFSGQLETSISGLAALGAHASSRADSIVYEDGAVYVVDTGDGTVNQIDPTTRTIVATVASNLVTPYDLVASGGYLWTTSGASWPPPKLVRIDPGGGPVTTYGGLEGAGLVASDADPDTIFSYPPTFSPLEINRIDVSSTPTVVTSQFVSGISNVSDIAVTPDGQSLIPAGGAPYQFDELSSATLQPDGTVYPAQPYPTAAATTAANGGLFAGGLDGALGPDLYVYRLGDPTTLLFVDTSKQIVAHRGLAFSPDGTELFAVYGTEFQPYVIDGAGTSPTTTNVSSAADSSTYGQPVTLTATVGAVEQAGFVDFSANGVLVDGCVDAPLQPDGASPGSFTASCTTSDLPGGTDSVQASFTGNETDAPSTSDATPVVVAPVPLTLTAGNATRGYGGTNPAVGWTFSGFVLGQSLATSDISGSPSCTSAADAASKPGSYPITCTLDTLASNDYTFSTFVPGTLTVTKAVTGLTVAAAKAKKPEPKLAATMVNEASGLPVAKQRVTFSEGGTVLCSAKTGTTGVATCHSPVSLAGQTTYDATFAGSAHYLAASGTGAVIPAAP